MTDIPPTAIVQAATLLGPDFQFQQLGALPPLAPPSSSGSSPFMGVMPQQYGGGGMYPTGIDAMGSMPDAHHSTYPHPLQPQNRNMGMSVPPMMMPHQMPGAMDMGLGSFIRPSHASQPTTRREMESYPAMGMNRMPSEQQELPGIVQSTAL